MDNSWQDLSEPHERLIWARLHWQTKNGGAATKRAAAESLGMKEDTYSAYERSPEKSKHITLDLDMARECGKKFKVSWVWLLTNEGTPFDEPLLEPVLKINNVLKNVSKEQQEAAADMIEKLFGKAG